MPLCETCLKLTLESLIVTNADTKRYGCKLAERLYDLELRGGKCDLCRLFVESFNAVLLPSPSEKKDPAVWASGIPATNPPTIKALTGVLVACNGRSVTFDLYDKSPLASSINGQAIAPEIKAAQVAAFIRAKEEICTGPSHERCQKTLSGGDLEREYRPPRLWNVDTNTLVEDPSLMQISPYTALSYTWGDLGDVGSSRLLSDNREARMQGKKLPDSFPQVYLQAFEITKQLGVRFIWIDALCILQDRDKLEAKEDREKNFNDHVHKIYQNARVTICAIFKEPSSDPLQTRRVPSGNEVVDVVNGKYCIAKRLGSPAVDIGVENPQARPFWATRGWTFQERVLATSCVYLTSHQLYWECHTSLVEERGTSHPPIVYKRKVEQEPGEKPIPQSFWPSMVRDYSIRNLGYDTDKIAAITGISKLLSGDENNSFLKVGFMPARVGYDLLWQSGAVPVKEGDDQKEGLKRRVIKDQNRQVVGFLSQPPSWSWAYWNGTIDFETYLGTAKLSGATYSLPTYDNLLIQGAQYFELQAGNRVPTLKEEITDIVYSVHRNNLKILIDRGQNDTPVVGWGAFDVNPFRGGANSNEKSVLCVLISTTPWTKPNDKPEAANVLLLNRISTQTDLCLRAGVGQIWDARSVAWKTAPTISVRNVEEVKPKF